MLKMLSWKLINIKQILTVSLGFRAYICRHCSLEPHTGRAKVAPNRGSNISAELEELS